MYGYGVGVRGLVYACGWYTGLVYELMYGIGIWGLVYGVSVGGWCMHGVGVLGLVYGVGVWGWYMGL